MQLPRVSLQAELAAWRPEAPQRLLHLLCVADHRRNSLNSLRASLSLPQKGIDVYRSVGQPFQATGQTRSTLLGLDGNLHRIRLADQVPQGE
jgi:hypothetical protein